MKETIAYQSKVDKDAYSEFREKSTGSFNSRIMFQQYIDYLADPVNFNRFFSSIRRDEWEREEETVPYSIRDLDLVNWRKFLSNCRESGVFGNDIINVLVKRFNKNGYCFEMKVKI